MTGGFDAAWLAQYQAKRGAAATALAPAPRTAPRGSEEHDFQATVIDYLRLVLPLDTCMVFSIDHANARNALAGALRKRRGVIAGIPDIYIAHGPYTLWMELKARNGVLSTPQEDFRDKAVLNGHGWCAPRTLEEVEAALKRSPIPLRARLS